jgi:hypothetical protein
VEELATWLAQSRLVAGADVHASAEVQEVEFGVALPAGRRTGPAGAQALSVLAAYIPAEGLAAYVGLTAILEPTSWPGRAVATGLALALNVVFVLQGFALGQRERSAALQPLRTASRGQDPQADQAKTRRRDRRSKWRATAVASWALAAYISATPANVLTSFSWYALRYGGVAAFVTAALLPAVARRYPAATKV